MSDEWQEYLKDSRTTCKYGIKCYQKNPEHHKTFKHPPQLKQKIGNKKRNNNRFQPYKPKDYEAKPAADNQKDEVAVNDAEDEIKPSVSSKHDNKIDSDNENVPENLVKLDDNIVYYKKESDRSVIKECFLVEMPSDFYKFYECLEKEPGSVESLLSNVNLQLVGPFEFLLGKLPQLEDKDLYLVHWRFFYDPPEFQTVLKKKGKSEFHIGYFRDDPKEKPVFLASNDSSKDCIITPTSENIFGAVYSYLQNEKKSSPFISIACLKLMEKVKRWAEEHNFSLDEYDVKKRKQQMVSRTFHNAGIVVPYNKKTQLGYRKLAETDADLKKMFKKLAEAKSQSQKDEVTSALQPMITYANIAMDECDFGTGLEAGIALFCSGLKELQTCALKNMEVAYSLLGREVFSRIIQVHMKYRRKGPNMSVMGASK